MNKLLLVVFLSLIASCASNPGIINISPDTYMITRIDKAGIFGNAAAMKANVFQEANAFAASQGKVSIPISINETPVAPGRFASIEYQFRVVAKDDPEYARISLAPRPDHVTESKNTIDLNINQKENESGKTDFYAELMKLDDLRKRGILTEKEFQSAKERLLAK